MENLGDKSCFHQTRSHSQGLGCDYSVSVDTISTYCTDSYSEGSINLGGCCSLTVFCGNNLFSSGRLIQSSSFLPSMRIWSVGVQSIKARAPNPDILPPLARLQHPAAVLQLSHNTVDSGHYRPRPPSQPQLSGSVTRHRKTNPSEAIISKLCLFTFALYTSFKTHYVFHMFYARMDFCLLARIVSNTNIWYIST